VRATTKPYIGRIAMSLLSSVMAVVAGVAVLAAVAAPLNQLTQPGGTVVVTPTEPTGDATVGPAGLPDGVSLTAASPDALMSVFELPAGLRALTELSTSLLALAVGVGAWLIGRVVVSIEAGRPFDRRNPRRLAGVAAAVLLGGVVAPLSEGFVATAVLDHVGLTGPGSPFILGATMPLTPVGLALVVLVVAEAFRRGGTLADEVEGMV
jgi:hypothetical protein